MNPVKKKGGRPKGISKKTISYKVPETVLDVVREEIRPQVEKSIKKHLKKN